MNLQNSIYQFNSDLYFLKNQVLGEVAVHFRNSSRLFYGLLSNPEHINTASMYGWSKRLPNFFVYLCIFLLQFSFSY